MKDTARCLILLEAQLHLIHGLFQMKKPPDGYFTLPYRIEVHSQAHTDMLEPLQTESQVSCQDKNVES